MKALHIDRDQIVSLVLNHLVQLNALPLDTKIQVHVVSVVLLPIVIAVDSVEDRQDHQGVVVAAAVA